MVSDQDIIRSMQEGLNLSPTPYSDTAKELGIDEQELHQRLYDMMERGVLRRVGLVPNHYKLGYRHNAMTVWDIDDQQVDEIGELFGKQSCVSHCYRRPTHRPDWPYNLFAMVHGKSQQEVAEKIAQLNELSGGHCRHSEVLFSKKILKKTGLRLIKGGKEDA